MTTQSLDSLYNNLLQEHILLLNEYNKLKIETQQKTLVYHTLLTNYNSLNHEHNKLKVENQKTDISYGKLVHNYNVLNEEYTKLINEQQELTQTITTLDNLVNNHVHVYNKKKKPSVLEFHPLPPLNYSHYLKNPW